MTDFICRHCEDTGVITVRTTYPMSYVCAGSPPEYAQGVTEVRCSQCNPVARWKEEIEE